MLQCKYNRSNKRNFCINCVVIYEKDKSGGCTIIRGTENKKLINIIK